MLQTAAPAMQVLNHTLIRALLGLSAGENL